MLLSGGTTSLIGAPETGLTPADLRSLYSLLLGSGLDITAMNRIRKRFSRWGAGKLARALHPAWSGSSSSPTLSAMILPPSDRDPVSPIRPLRATCTPCLKRAGLWHKLPEPARRMVLSTESGETARRRSREIGLSRG